MQERWTCPVSRECRVRAGRRSLSSSAIQNGRSYNSRVSSHLSLIYAVTAGALPCAFSRSCCSVVCPSTIWWLVVSRVCTRRADKVRTSIFFLSDFSLRSFNCASTLLLQKTHEYTAHITGAGRSYMSSLIKSKRFSTLLFASAWSC